MNILLKKRTYLTAYFILLVFSVIRVLQKKLTSDSILDDWGFTEWMVNYQGGFVRRGLFGEILYQLQYHGIIDFYKAVIVITLSLYILLVVIFVREFMKKGYSLFLLPFIFLLGNPIINDFWLRKDVFVILIFILVIYLAVKKIRFHLIYINILLIIALLNHEAMAFFCFPILFLVLVNNFKDTSSSKYNFIKPILAIAPSLLCLLIVISFKGSLSTAHAIWDSWQSLGFVLPRMGPFELINGNGLPGAIGGISMSTGEGLSLFTGFLKLYSFNQYSPLFLILTLIAIYYILSNIHIFNNKKEEKANNKTVCSALLFFQFCTIIPLSIIGCDYGRWIFFWTLSTFAISFFIPDHKLTEILPGFVFSYTEKINKTMYSIMGSDKRFILLLALLVGFTRCFWNFLEALCNSSIFIVTKNISLIFINIINYIGV